jgi:ubiquinone/menaquinone biosynthesis C-methylase UbiE
MAATRPPHGFEVVDLETNAQGFVDCLDAQSADPFHRAVRQQVFSALAPQPGDEMLDLGSGTGEDARLLAQLVAPGGRVVGIDASETMVARARERTRDVDLPVTFQRGDAHDLGFPDASFEGCYAIRTFQHLADPRRALAELHRVLRPSGRLAIVDPDHESTVVDVGAGETERALMRRFLTWRAGTIRSGSIAHQVRALAVELGLERVRVTPMVNLRTDFAAVERVSQYLGGVRRAQADGLLSAEEADCLTSALQAAGESGRFLSATTFFLTSGVKE